MLRLAVLLALAGALIAAGVATWSTGAALIVAGVEVAAFGWLFFGDIGTKPE